ncbi:MAG: LL-diaminopimelate aminotransferase [Candidatus Eisenbacteria bacterium]|nr:LL-diaminopimelate aminotransferase [Candidatus Eisenbacteria bacterium]
MIADRLKKLPRYFFVELDFLRAEMEKKGVSVINLSVGDPDIATPFPVVEKLKESASLQPNQTYPPSTGLQALREKIAAWMAKRFNVTLDPDKEVLVLVGSKEGIVHLSLALLNCGDVSLVPQPGYPAYKASAVLAGGDPHPLPLKKERGYLPDFGSVSEEVLRRTKLVFLNYPNNPTGAVCDKALYEEAAGLARKYGFVVASDAAYSEITFDGYKSPSLLQIPGAKDIGIEFHSFSKTFSMAGWRIAFAVGGKETIQALASVKSNLDSSVFKPIQFAAIEALSLGGGHLEKLKETYRRRRDLAVERLLGLGVNVAKPLGSFYLWVPVPQGCDSAAFTKELLHQCGVLVAPGTGFGEEGEGYVRISLTSSEEKLEEAFGRISDSHLFSRCRDVIVR